MAGVSAAAALRDQGFDGSITLVGAEPFSPYDRPPLSKAYLRGESPGEKIALKPEGFYEVNEIDLMLESAATSIGLDSKRVRLEGGQELPYDKLLLSTGSRNRRLNAPGIDLEGVLTLRTLGDADRIRAVARPGGSAVLVGMGFIGCEVAASLRRCGVGVTVVEPLPVPLQPALGPEIGRVVAQFHRDNGVRLKLGESLESFEGSGRVECVVTAQGERIGCDFAVVGVGVRPATELAERSGIAVDDGIVVDELCRTSAEDVYAAGDVTRHFHPLAGKPLRVEHWQNALKQGQAAAASMLGKRAPYDLVHWFWSDQYEHNLQYTGFHSAWDRLVVRGELEERKFVAFYLEGGRVVASAAMNNGRDLRRAKELVGARATVDPAVLEDPSADLRKVAG